VLAALRDLDAVRDQYAAPYARFQQLFAHLDDGHAGKRLEWLFRPAVRERLLVSADATVEGPGAMRPPVGSAAWH
jgi:hypothetical protein